MTNIEMEVKGNKLILTIDLTKEQRMSGSGRNMMIATTGGNVDTGHANGAKFGLNVYKRPEEKKD